MSAGTGEVLSSDTGTWDEVCSGDPDTGVRMPEYPEDRQSRPDDTHRTYGSTAIEGTFLSQAHPWAE